MTTLATPILSAQATPRRKLWTREEARFIQNSGLLADGQYELIEGELLLKVPKNPPHVTATRQTAHWASEHFGQMCVRTQDPLILDLFNEPEPDVAVTKDSEDAYTEIHPTASEVHLVIEVSDSTLEYDLTRKAALYARAGVAEYWVLDLPNRRLHVHLDPSEAGYGRVTTLAESQTIAPLANPNAPILVSALLP
jgi:Uma2 family endonuclease